MSSSKKVVRNIVTTILTQLITWGLAFSVLRYLPGYLGDVNLGRLTLVSSLMAIFGVAIPVGTSVAMVKDIARDHSLLPEYTSAALLMRAPLSLLAIGATIAAAWLLHYPPILKTLIYAGSAGMALAAFNDALSSGLRGMENMQRVNAASLTEKFVVTVMTLILVFAKAPLWVFALVGGVSGLAALFVYLSAFRLSDFQVPRRATMKYLFHAGLPYFGWIVSTTLYGQTDPIIIHWIAGAAAVGWYSVSFRLIGTMLFIPVAISTALLPTLSRLFVEDRDRFNQFAQRALAIIMLCAIPMSAVLIFQPGIIISLLHYPAQFRNSIPVLRIGGVSMLLYYATCFLGPLIVSCDRQSPMLRVSFIAVLIGIPSCIGMTYWTDHVWRNGAAGAAASDTVLELFLLYSYLRLLPEKTFGKSSFVQILRLAAASVPMLLLLTLSARLHIGLWIFVPCTITYLVMCWAVRAITKADMALLKGAFARKVQT